MSGFDSLQSALPDMTQLPDSLGKRALQHVLYMLQAFILGQTIIVNGVTLEYSLITKTQQLEHHCFIERCNKAEKEVEEARNTIVELKKELHSLQPHAFIPQHDVIDLLPHNDRKKRIRKLFNEANNSNFFQFSDEPTPQDIDVESIINKCLEPEPSIEEKSAEIRSFETLRALKKPDPTEEELELLTPGQRFNLKVIIKLAEKKERESPIPVICLKSGDATAEFFREKSNVPLEILYKFPSLNEKLDSFLDDEFLQTVITRLETISELQTEQCFGIYDKMIDIFDNRMQINAALSSLTKIECMAYFDRYLGHLLTSKKVAMIKSEKEKKKNWNIDLLFSTHSMLLKNAMAHLDLAIEAKKKEFKMYKERILNYKETLRKKELPMIILKSLFTANSKDLSYEDIIAVENRLGFMNVLKPFSVLIREKIYANRYAYLRPCIRTWLENKSPLTFVLGHYHEKKASDFIKKAYANSLTKTSPRAILEDCDETWVLM